MPLETENNVITVDFGKNLGLDHATHMAIFRSGHPAAIRFQVWVSLFIDDVVTGRLRPPTRRERAEVDAMIREAIKAVLPVQLDLPF
jgi:hypothetical protein